MTRTTLRITADTPPPYSDVSVLTGSAVGVVNLDDGRLSIQSESPAALLLIAEAASYAARLLAAQLDTDAARSVVAEFETAVPA